MNNKKLCFVVTPIGNNNTDIRRHIEGIIDQAIAPALSEKFKIEVSHRKYEIGSINDRIINSIYRADLVIANLTTLNPNVMFELAMRYSFGKPAIVIAENGTKLPFDIIDENTIFYINDPSGAADLKEKLAKFESSIDYSKQDYGPIYNALKKVSIFENPSDVAEGSNKEFQNYVIDRLDQIERKIDRDNDYPRIKITDIDDYYYGDSDSKRNRISIFPSYESSNANSEEFLKKQREKILEEYYKTGKK